MPGSIQWIGSPNFAKGRQGYQPLAIVIHIMQGTLADTDSWFDAVKSQVSAHYGVGKDGSVHQYVGEGDTAWHAGRVNAPTWPLLRPGVNPNWYTIGIEHEGQSGVAWTDDMYAASASLVAAAANRWGIALDRQHIIGHHEIYSLKPFCPGDGVDLDHVIMLAQQGVQSIASYAFVAKPGAVHTIPRRSTSVAPRRPPRRPLCGPPTQGPTWRSAVGPATVRACMATPTGIATTMAIFSGRERPTVRRRRQASHHQYAYFSISRSRSRSNRAMSRVRN